MLKGIIILFILVTCGEGIAQNAFTLSGKLRLLNPLEIRVESLKGDILLSLQVAKDGGFKSGPKEIEPDEGLIYTSCQSGTRNNRST